jgi:hypothetical protein
MLRLTPAILYVFCRRQPLIHQIEFMRAPDATPQSILILSRSVDNVAAKLWCDISRGIRFGRELEG